MFNEEILITMGLYSGAVWAVIDKLKPIIQYRLEQNEIDFKWKPRITLMTAFLLSLILVYASQDVRFFLVGGKTTVGLLAQSFDVVVTAIFVMLGDEAIHILIDLGRVVAGSKTLPVVENTPNE